jgi:hypothetical protein
MGQKATRSRLLKTNLSSMTNLQAPSIMPVAIGQPAARALS